MYIYTYMVPSGLNPNGIEPARDWTRTGLNPHRIEPTDCTKHRIEPTRDWTHGKKGAQIRYCRRIWNFSCMRAHRLSLNQKNHEWCICKLGASVWGWLWRLLIHRSNLLNHPITELSGIAYGKAQNFFLHWLRQKYSDPQLWRPEYSCEVSAASETPALRNDLSLIKPRFMKKKVDTKYAYGSVLLRWKWHEDYYQILTKKWPENTLFHREAYLLSE